MAGDADKQAAKRRAQVARGLDRAYGATEPERIELDALDLVDLLRPPPRRARRRRRLPPLRARVHRGAGYYLEAGHRLCSSATWRSCGSATRRTCSRRYPRTLALEAEFHRPRPLRALLGQPRRPVARPSAGRRSTSRALFAGLDVREALKLERRPRRRALGRALPRPRPPGNARQRIASAGSRASSCASLAAAAAPAAHASTSPARTATCAQRHDAAMFAWARERTRRSRS